MTHHTSPRFLFVLSTGGALMNRVLQTETVRRVAHSAVATTDGPALEAARAHGLPATVLPGGTNNEVFCGHVLDYIYAHDITHILSFYTRFYSAEIRHAMQDRIINFHPSLLPAFKGMDGFGDGLRYHTPVIGTTVELIKDVMDEGKIIMQSACANDRSLSAAQMRHRIFEQQGKTLVQVVDWIVQGRLMVAGDRVSIEGARYTTPAFVPALENAEALSFEVGPLAT